MIECLIVLAVLFYFAANYNFFWFLGIVALNLLLAKSLVFKIALVLIAAYYVYDAVDMFTEAVHRAPITFDLLKARGR